MTRARRAERADRAARADRARCVVAGDVGGTHARFAFFDVDRVSILHQEVLPSRSFRSFEAVFARFLAGAPEMEIAAATFGIAGPVVDGRVQTTNLPWSLDARKLARAFALPKVTLLNDLVAVGLGALHGAPRKQVPIFLGRPKRRGGNLAVIAAGTGLGEAALIWDGARHVPCPSEGAHVEFAPRTPLEGALLEELARTYGHVSYERVASASVLHDLYAFVARTTRIREAKPIAEAIAEATDRNAEVVARARSGESEIARRALDLWASVYGAEAGNLALKCFATSGVYVAGSVSAALADVLANGLPERRGTRHGKRSLATPSSPFLRAFVDKGRLRPVVERMPIAVVCDKQVGIHGAAAHAAAAARGD